jgi:hypothetical protein
MATQNKFSLLDEEVTATDKIIKHTDKKTLLKTKLCNLIENGKNCPYKEKCRFAHSINEIVIFDCGFGAECRYVYKNNGKWCNKEGKKVCFHRHVNETNIDYFNRIDMEKELNNDFILPNSPKTTTSFQINVSNIEELKIKMEEAIANGVTEMFINLIE